MRPPRHRMTLGRLMIAVAVVASALAGGRSYRQAREAERRWRSCSLKTLAFKIPDAADYRARAAYHAGSVENLGRLLDEAEADDARAAELARDDWSPDRLRAWIAWHDGARRRNGRAAAHPALFIEPDPPMPGYE